MQAGKEPVHGQETMTEITRKSSAQPVMRLSHSKYVQVTKPGARVFRSNFTVKRQ